LNLHEILDAYFTSPEKLPVVLRRMDKEVLISSFVDILHRYANDLNSSALREYFTLLKAGYQPKTRPEKLGYNGISASGTPCDVKPINIRSDSGNKLNGSGNFSDFTHERLQRYLNDNIVMLVSGFVDGRLVYILEFPFSCLEPEIRRQLDRFFTQPRARGQYLRSASFSFKHYKDCTGLRVVYKAVNLEDFGRFLTKELLGFLREAQCR